MNSDFDAKKPIIATLLFQASGFQPIAPGVTESSRLAQLYAGSDLVSFFQSLFYFALTIGAIMAMGRLIWAGYLYMGSGGMWSSKDKAKGVFGEVILGTLLLLGTWLVLYQINPEILKLNILAAVKKGQVSGLSAPLPDGNRQGTDGGVGGCSYTDPDTGVCLVRN